MSVRSWESRVRGAAQKTGAKLNPASLDDALDGGVAVADHHAEEDRAVDTAFTADAQETSRSADNAAPDNAAPNNAATAPNPSLTGSTSEPSAPASIADARARFGGMDAEELNQLATGLHVAINALEAAVAVVDRSTGAMLWGSARWIERFGEQPTIARYMATSTELGESPLPAPGDTWQRTRSVVCADGSEDLTELLLIGEEASAGRDVVTLTVVETPGSRSVVTDRSEVMSIIDGAIEEAQDGSVGVLYVDLDRFKVVHDLVGSLEARRILELVARRLSAAMRASDLVFRLASDEFVILSCELEDPAVAAEVAERLRQAIASMPSQGHDLALTASIGVAVSSPDASGESLLSAAETAVYLAKGRGRNRVAVHDDDLKNRSQRLLTVERQLRRAIEQREVGFAYQPLVHLRSGKVIGAEALLRLGGEVGLSAVEVVAAAEHSGLMGSLGALVLDGVEDQVGHLLREPGNDSFIMVNLSATQMADDNLTSTLDRLAADSRLIPGRLAVEVPEIVVRENEAAFKALGERIRPRLELGIDGFGVGYDSIGRLDAPGVDYVKLHRSLTATIGTDHDNRDEIGALIKAASERQIAVVALGVERQDQAAVLAELGCTMAQGFLYAGAIRANELEELMATGFTDSV